VAALETPGPGSKRSRAIDAPGVRTGLRRKQAARLLVIALGVITVAAGAIGIGHHRRGADTLRHNGVEVTGRVVAKGSDSVTVSYAFNGRARSFTAPLGDSAPGFRVGQRILILVDPNDPDRRLVQGQAQSTDWLPILLGAVIAIGGLAVIVGIVGLARGSRETRLLRTGEWRRVGLRTARRPALPGLGRHVILVNETGREHVLGITSTGLGDGAMRALHGRDRAEIVGDPTERIVLRAEGDRRVVSARRAPNRTVDRRWRLALGAPPRR
jgi:hypothetical protein